MLGLINNVPVSMLPREVLTASFKLIDARATYSLPYSIYSLLAKVKEAISLFFGKVSYFLLSREKSMI